MTSQLRQAIKERADAIWEQEGRPDGKDVDHWLRAEFEIISSSLTSNPRTGYENFEVECPWCQNEIIFNRASDLGTFQSIVGQTVVCLNSDCRKSFWISNDSINTPHEMLIFDVKELYKQKHYMNCILNLAQAYEIFFSLYLRVEMLFKPFGFEPDLDINKLNQLATELYKKVRKYGFVDMRSLFLLHIMNGNSPNNLTQSKKMLAAFPNKPSAPKYNALKKAVKDTTLLKLLKSIKDSKIHEMRNRVIHQGAYRPTREDVDLAYTETADTLLALTSYLDLNDDISHYT
jgi:Protein of unknown function (DUF2934)